MIAIRLQRRGRKGHAQYRVIVQESQLSPKSGRVIAALGSYDPHSKVATLDNDKADFYLSHGAQPSDRVAKIFKAEKIKLPSWVNVIDNQKRDIRNPEKLRKNQPAEAAKPEVIADKEEPAENNEDSSAEAEVETVEKLEDSAKPEEETKVETKTTGSEGKTETSSEENSDEQAESEISAESK